MKRIKDDRIKHIHSVAEYMADHAEEYGLDEGRCYVLGLLHDVGYAISNNQHESVGGALLDMYGYCDAKYIIYHGITPSYYKELKHCDDEDIPKPLVLLWEADLMIDVNGKEVGYQKRLESMKARCGEKIYKQSLERANWLIKHNHGKW